MGMKRGWPKMEDLLAQDYAWTPRQRQVLDLIARGKSNAELALTLGVSIDGAKWHMREILSKLGVDTREEAAEYWRRYNGWSSRLSRAFHGLAAGSAWKALAGASAVVVVVVAVAFMVRSEGASTPGAAQPLPPFSIEEAKQILEQDAPDIAAIVEAVESGNVTAVEAALQFQEFACVTPVGPKGHSGADCARWGVPQGTLVRGFQSGPFLHFSLTPAETAAAIARVLAAQPRLELVLRRDQAYFLSFAIDPILDEPVEGSGWMTEWFVIRAESGAHPPVVSLDPGGFTTALESAGSFKDPAGAFWFEVLGTSQEILVRAQRDPRPWLLGSGGHSQHGTGDWTGGSFWPQATILFEVSHEGQRMTADAICPDGPVRVADAREPFKRLVLVPFTAGRECRWDVRADGQWSIETR
jgi:DNA-binding CsgD family transcriptional regulator